MKTQHILTLAVGVLLIGNPFVQLSAQETAPATPPPEAPKMEEKQAKPSDPEKEKWNAVRKQANEDPKVKAAMDAAAEAKRQANLKMYAKMREIDPSLAPMLDKEEARLKPKEVKLAPEAKAAAKPAPASTKPAVDKPTADKKVAPAPAAKDKAVPAPKPAS